MPGPRYKDNGDSDAAEEPVFNPFGKPLVCAAPEPDPEADPPDPLPDCCSLCEAWTQCLQRVPWKLDLNGFYLHELFNYIRFNGLACCISENGSIRFTGFGVEPDAPEFVGTYVVEPKHMGQAFSGVPDRSGGHFTCATEHHDTCGSHFSRWYRTVLTPEGQLAPVTRVYIDMQVACRLNDDDEPVAVVEVYFLTFYEQQFGCVSLCPNHRSSTCHLLLQSDEIPITPTTDWTDFIDVPLNPIEQFEDDGVTPANRWHDDCAAGGSYEVACDPCPREDEECCWPGPSPPVEYRDTEPPTLNKGNFASVAVQSCDFIQDCDYCEREEPIDRTQRLTPVEIDFETTPATGCCKTFTAVVPECIEDPQIFWSFGKTGSPVPHCLLNVADDSVTDAQEYITLIVVDARGCIYRKSRLVTCDCPCPGASGTLSVEPHETIDCCYVVTAVDVTNSSEPLCDGGPLGGEGGPGFAFIEYCVLDNTCLATLPLPDECFCDDVFDGACYPCCSTIIDGTAQICVEEPTQLKWRLWDASCGCPGPWNYVDLECNVCTCCTGPLAGFNLTFSGFVNSEHLSGSLECDDCLTLNVERAVPMETVTGEDEVGSCGGSEDFAVDVGCSTAPFTATWGITCDETGFWLAISFNLGGWFDNTSGSVSIFLGETMPECASISDSDDIVVDLGSDGTCVDNGLGFVTIGVEAYV